MRLQGRVAIVTGGGSGIGKAFCRRFLAEGARVMIADLDDAQAKAAVEELSAEGEIDRVHTDVADEASTAEAAAATLERFGGVHVLVNNAAIYGDYDPLDHSLAYLRRMFDVNVHGQWLMARAVAPELVRQRWGRIVNVASIAAYLHQLGAMADGDDFQLGSFSYQHSKFSVIGLTRHMAGQLGPFGVTVNCIAPGLTMTPATERQVPKELQPMFAQMSAARTNVQPEDLTGAAVFFASEDARMVNGQLLCVDGGNVMPV